MILHADSVGQGPPVALLHGLFGRGRNLAALARKLSVTRRVVSLDLRNHGESPHVAGMEYRTMAEDVLQTLTRMDAVPADILGHSMGGKTAMMCALLAPGMVGRLIIADIAPVAYNHANAAIAAAMLGMVLAPGMQRRDADVQLQASVPDAGIRRFLLQNFAPGIAPHWRIGLACIADAMHAIESWPPSAETMRFEGPALFVNGAQSDYINAEGRLAARTLFPHARFVTLKHAGHWLHADQPEAFAGIVTQFLAREPG